MSTLEVLRYSELEKRSILKEHGKSAESVLQDVESIRKWIEKQPHLPEVTDEGMIERFLMLNKFSIERAKQKLDMYYTVRAMVPEFYDKDPNGVAAQKIMDVVYYIPLPKLTKDLHRVTVVKAKTPNSDDFDAAAYVAHALNVTELRLRTDYCLSEIHIYDLCDVKFSHLVKFTPTLVKRALFVVEKVFTTRVQGLHLVNAPTFVDHFVGLLKKLLKPKLAERIFVHKDMESLYQVVQQDILPEEFGGEEKSLDELTDDWKKCFLQFDGLFKRLRALNVNEKLRPDESTSYESGEVQGNFKRLNID